MVSLVLWIFILLFVFEAGHAAWSTIATRRRLRRLGCGELLSSGSLHRPRQSS